MAKKISWLSAAEIIGVTPRTMRRWRERLEEHGYDGLRDRRKGKVSQKRVPLGTCEQVLRLYVLRLYVLRLYVLRLYVLRLYQEKYFDFNVKHFQEKLEEEHGINSAIAG